MLFACVRIKVRIASASGVTISAVGGLIIPRPQTPLKFDARRNAKRAIK